MTHSDFLIGLDARVQDANSRLTDAIKTACMQQALKAYSAERPREQVAELVADGTDWLELPDDWEPEFSRLRRVELLELGAPALITPGSYRIRRDADGAEVLFWQADIPAAGTVCILTYTAIHTISATAASFSSGDDEALMDLAASHAALRLAAAYIDDVDPEIGTVTLDNKTRSDRYRALAKDLLANYQRAIGATRGATTGRSRFATWQR